MSWVGLLDEKTSSVIPFAWAGFEEGYLTKIVEITTKNIVGGKGPAGTSIREGRIAFCKDIAHDPVMEPWREEALKRGYYSSLAIPLKVHDKIIGNFSAYANEVNFFSIEEVGLLEKVAENISFALNAIVIEDERRHLEEVQIKQAAELKSSNAELENFAYAASHDLQEPIRMVNSFLKLLEKRLDGQLDDTSKQYMHFATDGGERMNILIKDLLEYSRVGTNKEVYNTVNLNEVMEYATRVLKENIANSGAVLKVKPLPLITANKTLITELFIKLVNNALKYHGDKSPEIEVGCTEENDTYNFYVKDNGIGIDPKFYDKIFIIFQRLHTKKEYSGSGIGLAICKKIVERHQGKIWVTSEVEKGSTFYFTIPKLKG